MKNVFRQDAVQPDPQDLRTDRLSLRIPTLADFDDMAAMWSDADVTAKVTPIPLSREEVWARLHRLVGHWKLLGYGHWIVRENASNRFLGEIGFFDFKRGFGAPYDNLREIGWMFATEAQGVGYASEAVAAALKCLEAGRGTSDSFCLIDPQNVRSLRLAAKFMFAVQDEIVFKGKPMWVLRRQEGECVGSL